MDYITNTSAQGNIFGNLEYEKHSLNFGFLQFIMRVRFAIL